MNKKILKIFSLVLVMIVLFSLTYNSLATEFINKAEPGLPGDSGPLKNATNSVIGAMMWVGYACAIGMVVFIGIKYILASADEKASLKGMLVKVIIGSFIIVLSLQITNAVISIMSDGSGGSVEDNSDVLP